jgi:urease accessory protein
MPMRIPTMAEPAPVVDPALLPLLHLADTAFPTGGYAHSFGLETYCQEGRVTSAAELMAFLTMHLEGAAGPTDATAAVAVLRAFRAGDLAACGELDATLEAMKPVRELREASRQMGRQTLRVATALTRHPALAGYLAAVDAGERPGHHGVAFGLAAGALGVEAEAAATGYLYSATALLVGAALRLMRLGQLEGQRVLWSLHPVIARVAAEAAARDPSDLWGWAPGLELAGIAHAGLDARLFRS